MHRKRLILAASLAGLCAASASGSQDEHREHGAHVHGAASLNIALEGTVLAVELVTPAVNVVGFEHPPRDDGEREAVASAVSVLEDADGWLSLPAGAGCRLELARVESALIPEEGAGHDHDHAHEDDHDGDDHDGSHDGDDHDDVHSEFHAGVEYQCDDPSGIDSIGVLLFERFPGMEEIALQMVTDTQQIGGELTPGDNVIDLAD